MKELESMIDLESACGLAIQADPSEHQLILPDDFVPTTYRKRRLQELADVWHCPLGDFSDDRIVYWYSAGLSHREDQQRWADANVIYGIVFFHPGCFAGEFVKSSGQFHPPTGKTESATPEIYTVLRGTGYFLLQKAKAPYTDVTDPILVEVRAGESFIVPPDYGHLQINPTAEPLIFSYVVMDGMQGVYEPYRRTQGAMYYVLDDPEQPYQLNPRYPNPSELRVLRASELSQHPLLKHPITYQSVLSNLDDLTFITQPDQYPTDAYL
jgi:glucose-6-phosphate isomerase